jgi:hypothetical protein
MRHLDHGQQRQQGKTDDRDHAESGCASTAIPAAICLHSDQWIILSIKDTLELDAPTAVKVTEFAGISSPSLEH